MSQLQNVFGMLNRNYGDLQHWLNIASQTQLNQRLQQNYDRLNAQVDAEIKKCNPDYEPGEVEAMGDVNIYAGITASDQTLQNMAETVTGGPLNWIKRNGAGVALAMLGTGAAGYFVGQALKPAPDPPPQVEFEPNQYEIRALPAIPAE